MSVAILMHEKFRNDAAAGAAGVAAATPNPARMELPPPVRRRTPLVERYRAEITEFFRTVIPVVFGLALFVAVWAIIAQSSTLSS